MRTKAVEKLKPSKPRGNGWKITLQELDDLMILNAWNYGELYARHVINAITFEFATWFAKDKEWRKTKVESAIGIPQEIYGTDFGLYSGTYKRIQSERWNLAKKDEDRIRERIRPTWGKEHTLLAISAAEMQYGSEKRESAEKRRWQKVCDLMGQVPAWADGFPEWIDDALTGGMHWAVKNTAEGKWYCSYCGKVIKVDERKIKHKQEIRHAGCGQQVTVLKRTGMVDVARRVMMIQNMDEEKSVIRHFRADEVFHPREGNTKTLKVEEVARLILWKNGIKKDPCEIYWGQWSGFDCKSNPQGQRLLEGLLFNGNPEEIREALAGTYYEPWARLFGEFSKKNLTLDYNMLMVGARNERFTSFMEMLFRGRFYKLMQEESTKVSVWDHGAYKGAFHLEENEIGKIFGIRDRQRINRLRDVNGGGTTWRWMQWSDETGAKITDETLRYLVKNNFWPSELETLTEHMTLQQAVNYVKRQAKESYKGKSARMIVSQYDDYVAMCKKLMKKMDDEMVFRPRELKRRHDEAVEEIRAREAEIQAEEYSKKYKEAEAVLREIKAKYEWQNDEFIVKVPERIVDVVKEGRALHHCVGNTDRYFDRIKQHETYICFLRKTEAPDEPFYTLEVEPCGTIRQHRGFLDEEPEIETIKPFLRLWQKEIKKRMSEEDRRLAKISKEKREENVKELQEKKNTVVLQGLAEDLMEAM